ncbi:cyclodeaminase/cyclohydrolase family protein [Candidatus Formimonas warabiya]|uniref:Cyclodeaminase/cyclohydrolase domain-containing protein n=1 Tax=Formimonas warabiya TaxID=1761012 RepID=A0A3G1KRV7_FORW1|nr:cyclodeaminase/cyclohydrolase family protein [Candidatus Formimonas warabiya]ATW25170.1 hypothetical protein DCMF_10670 [Candidatus Formimonas warabiya]
MLVDFTCREFLDELAAQSPAPGGGSVSALAGSLGGALVSMVARLTVGKEEFNPVREEMHEVVARAEELRSRLTGLIDRDTEAFNRVMGAYRLPKGTEAEKGARAQAIQEAMKNAALLPLEAAACCLDVLHLAREVVAKGTPNALSDGGVAALMAYAGLRGALFNVAINLAAIKDGAWIKGIKEQKGEIQDQGEAVYRQVIGEVEGKLSL